MAGLMELLEQVVWVAVETLEQLIAHLETLAILAQLIRAVEEVVTLPLMLVVVVAAQAS
jgi:hypothetical protein